MGSGYKVKEKEDMKRISKRLLVCMLSVISALCMSVAVFAESGGGSGTGGTAVVSAMTGVANDMTSTATSIIPIALGVVGISMVVVFGIKIFKKIYNK